MPNKLAVVTSFRGDHWNIYAKECIDSFVKNWPEDVKLYAYYNDWPEVGLQNYDKKRVKFIDLTDNDNGLCKFLETHKDNPNKSNWRTDASRWAYKVYTEYDFFVKNPPKGDIGIWLDADTVTYNKITHKELSEWLPEGQDICILDRTATNYAEAGFFMLKMSNLNQAVIADLYGTWATGEVFNYKEWHDAFVLTRLLKLHQAHGMKIYNLSPYCADLNAFECSPLVRYLYHNKGMLKFKQNEQEVANIKTDVQHQPKNSNKKPIIVQPQDCMPVEEIRTNILTNSKRIPSMLKKCQWNNEEVAIVSAGPSLKNNLENIRIEQNNGVKIICVKHSHNILLENGIQPWGCTVLDPRPFHEKSTHGFVRKELLAEPHPSIKYFVATMSNTDVVTHLLDKKANVIGWDAYCNAIEGWDYFKDRLLITGGTCAGMRSIGLVHTLGFRTVHLYGFDSCNDGPPKDKNELGEDGTKKWLKVSVGEDNKPFWTTGELLAQAQDFEKLMQNEEVDLQINVHGTGLIPALWNDGLNKKNNTITYRELFDEE